MTIELSIRALSEKISKLRGCLQALAVTAGQDAPADLPPAESLANSTTETLGWIHEAFEIVQSALADDPSAVPGKLVRAQEKFSRAFLFFFSDLSSFRNRDLSGHAEPMGPDWSAWKATVTGQIEQCELSFIASNESFQNYWMEISGAAAPARQSDHSAPDPALAYAQHLFGNYMEWYTTADSKAQLILGLDGAFLTFLTGSIFAKGKDATDLLGNFGIATWIFLGWMCAAMTLSMFSALRCLWSRVYREREIAKMLPHPNMKSRKQAKYSTDLMWFFQMVRALEKDTFEGQMLGMNDRLATRALASQIYELSGRITRKHYWVNVGFFCAALSLTALLAAMVSYIIRVT